MGLTDDRNDPGLNKIGPDGMQESYLVLSEEERAKGFVRPLYRTYRHHKCGTNTTMALPLCETYARDPKFYGGTYCAQCSGHYPVGENGEFEWVNEDKTLTGMKVGT